MATGYTPQTDEHRQDHQDKKEVNKLYCDNCTENLVTSYVDAYCVECNSHLCVQCLKQDHCEDQAMGHHIMVRTEAFLAGAKEVQNFTMTCSEHTHLLTDMICKTHDLVCCNMCMKRDHKYCARYYIPDYAEKEEHQDDMKRKREEAKRNEERILRQIQLCDARKAEIERKTATALAEIDKFSDRITEMVQDMATRARQEIQFQGENVANTVGEHNVRKQIYVDTIEENLAELKALLDSGAQPDDPKVEELLRTIQAAKTEMDQIGDGPRLRVDFQLNTELLDMLNSIDTLGSFSITDFTDSEVPETNDNNDPNGDTDERANGELADIKDLLDKLQKTKEKLDNIGKVTMGVPSFQPNSHLEDLLQAVTPLRMATLQIHQDQPQPNDNDDEAENRDEDNRDQNDDNANA